MCSRNDDPTTYDAPKVCKNPNCKCILPKEKKEEFDYDTHSSTWSKEQWEHLFKVMDGNV